jgi:hypothetical protein
MLREREPGEDDVLPGEFGYDPRPEPPPIEDEEPDEVDAGDTWEQLNAQSDTEERQQWLLPNILPPRGVVLVVGEQKSGKTLWVSSLVGQLLARAIPTTYAMQESAQSILRARLRLGIEEGTTRLFRSLYRRGHHLRDEAGLLRLVAAVRANRSKVVVLDSFTRFCRGLDLNKAEVMAEVGDRLERLSKLAECVVIVIHHPRKGGQGQNARKELTSADSRGSGDLLAVASVIALVERAERTEPHTYCFTVRCEDSWYQPFEEQHVTVRFRESPAIVVATGREETAQEAELVVDIKTAMLTTVRASPTGRLSMRAVLEADAVKALSRTTRLLRKCLDGLLGNHQLVEQPGVRGARMMCLPEVTQ